MDKFAKQANPLRARASRVEKSRRAYRDSRTLPSWYYRVHAISFKEKREVYADDFDEDLSEAEEDKEQERDDVKQFEEKQDCECGGDDPDCDCQFEDDNDIDKDDESERSYDGSDADYYYELKEEREERKQEKLRERKEKERVREMERTKEEEVRAAYRSLKKAKKERKMAPVGPLEGQSFKLFCSDHVDHFYSDLYAPKRVEFYHLDDANNPRLDKQKPSGEADMLYGDVYLDCDANCDFGPFRPPKRASRKAFKVKSCDGKYELSFKFIGNGYLKLRISREMVFMNPYSASPRAPLPAAPEMFEFVGIWSNWEKEKAERREKMAEARRSPSPRETWFEMNHPMGSWKSGYF
ncbi:hypothetical protein QBC46DRAFT_400360 [Diplogelasinospora grovesii]|uniref:Uncharacterized protein n=1 Tax=Diplogelasinospora grovesii TaxID=303347 RepID=A0AAN6MVJ2_9PEZI|nr:hypothetical protein QBC46DRAFT_400360 [Diplogelasinospora grovesii]